MQSPLPDSSVLEAGIIPDTVLPRTTDIQDRVRSLLRASLYETSWPRDDEDDETIYVSFDNRHNLVLQSPLRPTRSSLHIHPPHRTIPEEREPLPLQTPSPVLPSPHYANFNNILIPEDPIASRSSFPAYNHPDIDVEAQHPEESLALLSTRQKPHRQRHHRSPEWKHHHSHPRHNSKNNNRPKKSSPPNLRTRSLLCIGSGLLLAAILATYLSLALSQSNSATVPAWQHILFILSLMIVAILFAHSVVRLCLVCSHPASHQKRHLAASTSASSGHGSLRARQHGRRYRDLPTLSHAAAQEALGSEPEQRQQAEREAQDTPHPPPPAYGRWRGSVRVEPDSMVYRHVALDANSPTSTVSLLLPSPTTDAGSGLVSPAFSDLRATVVEEDEEDDPPVYTSPVRTRGNVRVGENSGGQQRVEIAELYGDSAMF